MLAGGTQGCSASQPEGGSPGDCREWEDIASGLEDSVPRGSDGGGSGASSDGGVRVEENDASDNASRKRKTTVAPSDEIVEQENAGTKKSCGLSDNGAQLPEVVDGNKDSSEASLSLGGDPCGADLSQSSRVLVFGNIVKPVVEGRTADCDSSDVSSTGVDPSPCSADNKDVADSQVVIGERDSGDGENDDAVDTDVVVAETEVVVVDGKNDNVTDAEIYCLFYVPAIPRKTHITPTRTIEFEKITIINTQQLVWKFLEQRTTHKTYASIFQGELNTLNTATLIIS